MTAEAIVRPMLNEDLGAVLAIEERAHVAPWTEGIFRDCMRVGYRCEVLQAGDALIGYLVMSVQAGEAHLFNLCIDPAHQGQGHGRRLLAHALQLARDGGAETIFLEVRPSNEVAIALYHGMAFQQVGVRKDYYPGPRGREDALVLARPLN